LKASQSFSNATEVTMSAVPEAVPHRAVGDVRIAVLVALPLLSAIAAGTLAAGPPPGVTRLSAAEAERAGRALTLLRQAIGGATLVELQPAAAGSSLLAVSGDGRTAAVADRLGENSGTLTLAMEDGAQLQVSFPGLLAAAFAPNGSWLAVIDGRGALWKLDPASGGHEQILDGPFVGTPVIADDGSLLLLAVPSVEAPYRSRLVRLTIERGVAEPIADEELVYAAFPLDGGDLAIVAHQDAATVVRRLGAGDDRRLVALGAGAVNVVVARDGRIAFERAGEGIFLLDAPGSVARSIGPGSWPCFAPDGTSLLVERDGQRLALSLDGSVLATAGGLTGFAGSAGCPS
jgi:hypothetical protein